MEREQMKFSAWRVQPRIDAGTAVWLCEKGHVDDHHFELAKDVEDAVGLCSRCGGKTTLFSLDQLACELRTRTAERDQLRQQVEKLIDAGDGWRKAISKRSTHTLNAADRALLQAFAQVRKEME